MTLMHIDALGTQARVTTGQDLASAFGALTDGDSPIMVLVHGFRYDPNTPDHCPHSSIFSCTPSSHLARANISWVNGLGYNETTAGNHLCIGFGWNARGTIWRANANARNAAIALRKVLAQLRHRFPRRPIALLAHSLGARVALDALHGLAEGTLSRMVLMSPAVMQSRAQAALDCPAGRSTEVINIISRQNDLYDAGLEWMLHPRDAQAKALGYGLGHKAANWLDIEIDNPTVSRNLAQIGYPLAPAPATVCHWSCYTRQGVFDLYKAILCTPRQTPMGYLRNHLDTPATPRWSRLVGPDMRRFFLSFALRP